MDVPTYAETLIVTDAAINIAPTMEDKVDIIQNAIDLAHAMRFPEVRVAILSAMETVNPKVPSTVEAGALCKMADRGQITGAILDGPLALDNAINLESVAIKKIDSPVAGRANVLVVPDLEAGNMLAKSLTFLAGADAAGIVLGARVPIILTSRADSVMTRLASCAVAVLVAYARREAGTKTAWRVTPMDAVAVLNAGSSSIKFSLFTANGGELELVARGQAEGLFTSPRFVAKDADGRTLAEKSWGDGVQLGHGGALDHLVSFLRTDFAQHRLVAVGHRVVHGGLEYSKPVRVDAAVVAALEKFVPLAPLHQPHNLAPIRALLERAPTLPQVACFDTAFHRGQPAVAQAFALPKAITDRGVRRYGFHGLSYEYIAQVLPQYDARAAAGRTVVLHLGNGASMCAIAGGPQRGKHDGLHRGRRPADGNALRQPRSGRDALPDGRARDGRARDREIDLPAVGSARRLRHLERHAHAGSERGSRGEGRDRSVRLPDRARAGLARGGARRTRRDRVHGRHRREQPHACARASAPTRRGSAWISIAPPTTRTDPGSARRRAASRRGWCRPTRN